MNTSPFVIENINLSEAWLYALEKINEAGGSEITPLVISLTDFSETDFIRKTLDTDLTAHLLPSIQTVSETIFPESLYEYSRYNRHELYKAYKRNLPRIKRIDPSNGNGTYFERMISFDTEKQINQLEIIISSLLQNVIKRRSKLQAAIFDPTKDHTNKPFQGFPCLLAAIPVDMIYILGSSLEQKRTESIFVTTAPSIRKVGHYYLLVLIDEDGNLDKNFVQDKIENTCKNDIPVTAMVQGITKFNQWLTEGHYLACKVRKIAVLLYDSSKFPLVIPSRLPEENYNEICDDLYLKAVNKVDQFIAGADLYMLRHQNKIAVFMLQQATEQALHAILKKATGLYINTHNIDKLTRYCAMVSIKVPDVFSRNNDKDKQLVSLLQKAYIESRYNDDFQIGDDDLNAIMKKVKVIKEILVE